MEYTECLQTWVGDATPCMTVLPSEERVKSVLRVANVASASSAVVQKSARECIDYQTSIYW